ncbi:hypothetical protein Tco_1417566 [Tanacetum coccineum]
MSYAKTSKQSSSYISALPSSNVSHFNSGNVMEDVLHSFVAESDQQIIYEDFDQIGKLDLEELDIKWKMAMLSVRVNRFEKKAGRKMNFNNKDAARFDKKKVVNHARYSAFKIKELEQDKPADPKALLSVDLMVNWSDHEESTDENALQVYGMIDGCDDEDEVACEFALMGVTSQELQTKLDNTLARFAKWKESSKNLAKLVDSSMTVKTKLGLGYGDYIGEDEIYYPTMPSIFDTTPEDVDGNSTPVRFVKEGEMNAVPPPITGKFMPTSIHSDFDESQMTYGKNSNDQSETDSNDFVSCASSDKSSEPKTNDFASCDSSDKSSSPKSVESSVFSPRVAESESNLKIAAQDRTFFNNNTPSFISFSHLIQDWIFMKIIWGVYSVQKGILTYFIWNNGDNIPPFIPQAAMEVCNVTFPAGTPVHADRPFPCCKKILLLSSADAIWVKGEDGELLLSPQQVVLGEIVDHICKGDPRTMENPLKNKDLGIVDSGCSPCPHDHCCGQFKLTQPPPPVAVTDTTTTSLPAEPNPANPVGVVPTDETQDVSTPAAQTISFPSSTGTPKRRKKTAKKRAPKPLLDMVDQSFIKFDSGSESDSDLVPWAAIAAWEVFSTPLGVGLILWGDLKVLLDSMEGGAGYSIWGSQQNWQVRSWRLYTFSNVHVLETMAGIVLYMFVDVPYPLSVKLMERMLKHKLELARDVVGNDLTTAEQLIGFIKNQLAAAQVPAA